MSKNPYTNGRPVFVVDGARTPFLKAKGAPGPFAAADLATQAGRSLLLRQPIEAEQLDEVILGSAMPGPDEANIARVVALRLGCGLKTPAYTVQRNCASGMQALDNAARDIAFGSAELVLAGGVDSMSHAPVLFQESMVEWLSIWMSAKSATDRARALSRFKPNYLAPVIGLLRGLTDPIVGLNMGQTAEQLAYNFGISREQMDEYAQQSHLKVVAGQEADHYQEIVPIFDGAGHVYDFDDGVRPDSNVEKLATLKPMFDRKFGMVTAGNSSQVTDGAAWLLLASEDAVKKHDLPVLGKITDCEWAGLDPAQMGLGPVHASTPILTRKRLKLDSIDFWEINEAFAAQVLGCLAAWKNADYCKTHLGKKSAVGELDLSKLNIDGGAIALGHPVGASGARIVLHMLHTLKRENAKRGIASLCIGGGQGGAMLIEAA